MDKYEKEKNNGVEPDNLTVINRAQQIYDVQKQIPDDVWISLLSSYTLDPREVETGQRIYLVRNVITWPAVVVDQHTARRVMLDQVGKHHLMEETVPLRHFRLLEATRWRDKWGPPRGESAAV